MIAKQMSDRFKDTIRQPNNALDHFWNEEKWKTRRRLAAARRERLFNTLFPRQAALSPRDAQGPVHADGTATRTPVPMRLRNKTAKAPVAKSIEDLARTCISESRPYAICFRDISFDHADGVLTMRGRLPSFYAKQVLQTLLRDLDGVERIDNQTDVVSATGLSSVRSH